MKVRQLLSASLPGQTKGKTLKGNKPTKQRYIVKAEYIESEIFKRFNVKNCYKWQVKHLRFVLENSITHLKPHTQYEYFLAIKAIVHEMGKSRNWLPLLRGPWENKSGEKREKGTGGRKQRLGNRKQV